MDSLNLTVIRLHHRQIFDFTSVIVNYIKVLFIEMLSQWVSQYR